MEALMANDVLSTADRWRIGVGYLLGFLILIALGYSTWRLGSDTGLSLRILVLLTGGLAGWTTGILATPQDEAQKGRFPEYLKALGSFMSGFVLARLDRVVDSQLAAGAAVGQALLGGILIFTAAFLVGLLMTAIGRLTRPHA
jgi:hypothetical protein